MDIRYTNNDFQFLLRVSVLIFNKTLDKVLLFNVEGRRFYMLTGGKVSEYEESLDAVKRELEEELGWKDLDLTFLAVDEELVNDKGYNNQQINLIYKGIYKKEIKTEEFKGLEGDWINFKWIPINELDKYEIYPKEVKEMALNSNKIYHFVNNLLKK